MFSEVLKYQRELVSRFVSTDKDFNGRLRSSYCSFPIKTYPVGESYGAGEEDGNHLISESLNTINESQIENLTRFNKDKMLATSMFNAEKTMFIPAIDFDTLPLDTQDYLDIQRLVNISKNQFDGCNILVFSSGGGRHIYFDTVAHISKLGQFCSSIRGSVDFKWLRNYQASDGWLRFTDKSGVAIKLLYVVSPNKGN